MSTANTAINQTKFINFRQEVINSNFSIYQISIAKLLQQLSYFLYRKGLI